MFGFHTTTAARLFANPTAKTHEAVTDYDKTMSFTLAASLCLLTGVIITPLVYTIYHWFNSKVMTEQALPFAKKVMHATIEGDKESGYRELKVDDIVYVETMKHGQPVITVKDIRNNKTLVLKDDLAGQVRDMTQEMVQKMGSEEERSLWWEVADWVSTLLELNPDVQITSPMYLEDIQSRAEGMVRAKAAANAKEEVLALLGDTSKPEADTMRKELADIYCIYADFQATLNLVDTFSMYERTEACIDYLKNKSENLKEIKAIFSDDASGKKLNLYLDSCDVSRKNAHKNDKDQSMLFFTNLSSAVNTLHSAMTHLSREEKSLNTAT